MSAGGHLDDELSALADGELDGPELVAAQAHLAACPDCAAELEAVSGVRSLVRALPVVPPRVPLIVRVVRHRWAAPVAAAAAAVAMALLAVTGSGGREPATPVPNLVRTHATSAVSADPVSQLAPAAVPVSLDPSR